MDSEEKNNEFDELISNATILTSFAKILLELLESQDFDIIKIPDLISLSIVIQKLTNEQKYRISEMKEKLCEEI